MLTTLYIYKYQPLKKNQTLNLQKKNNLKLFQFTHFTNPCNFTHFDNFHAILTVNSPVWGSKPTCTVCSKLEGLEMIGFSFSFNFLEFEPASKTEH